MLRSLNLFAAFLLTFSLQACDGHQARVDGTSEESFEASIDQIWQNFPQDKIDQLESAIAEVMFGDIDIFAIDSDPLADARGKLHGKSADEIIAYASEIAEERLAREKQQAIIERDELLERISEIDRELAAGAEIQDQLRKFTVDRSRFVWREDAFSDQGIIELTVTNGTASAISRAYFSAVLSSPGRSVPWVRETFNYSIPGGIEPGESLEWSLRPNMFGGWNSAPRDRQDTVLTVEVTRLDGPEGGSLYDLDELVSLEEERNRLNVRIEALELIVQQ